MFKSQPISMVQDAIQMSGIKLTACYQYKTAGTHVRGGTTTGKSLTISFYGINKTGGQKLIAVGSLDTTSAYTAEDYAASTIIGVPSKEYPYIYWTYDATDNDILRISADPQLFIEIRKYPDILESDVYTKAEVI
jgi:hypothetical protein